MVRYRARLEKEAHVDSKPWLCKHCWRILTQSSAISSPISACNFFHDDIVPATSVITYLWWKSWSMVKWEVGKCCRFEWLLSCAPYPCVCVCNRKHQTCSTQITFSLWYMQTGMKNTGQTRVQVITLYCQFRWGLTCVPSSSYDEALPIHVRVFGSGATGR